MTATLHRDYGLLGPEGALADAEGLVGATWYKAPDPRARMKQLMQRSNGPAIRDTLAWFALLALFGGLGAWAFVAGNLAWIPLLAVYGVLYGSVSDSRWHEAGHRTAFRTPWMNDVVYQIACFMIMRSPTVWRWSHTRHHTDTLIVGRDPEILSMRPPAIGRIALNFFGLVDVPEGDVADGAARLRPADRRGADVRARGRVATGLPRSAGVGRDLRGGRRDGGGDAEHPAAAARRRPTAVRRLAAPPVRPDPACRARRGRPRPPARLPARST